MTHWQVRAQAVSGAIMTFGLATASQAQAEEQARELIPFAGPVWFTVQPVPARPEQGS